MRQTYLGDGLEELLVVAHVVLGRIADYGMQRARWFMRRGRARTQAESNLSNQHVTHPLNALASCPSSPYTSSLRATCKPYFNMNGVSCTRSLELVRINRKDNLAFRIDSPR